MMSRCVFARHFGAERAAAGVSDRIQLTTRRSGDLFRRIGASTEACSRPATCPMDVRGYAMRSLRRGLAYLRQAMPGTVRCSANAPPVATMNRLQGIVWSGLPGQSVQVCVTLCPRRHTISSCQVFLPRTCTCPAQLPTGYGPMKAYEFRQASNCSSRIFPSIKKKCFRVLVFSGSGVFGFGGAGYMVMYESGAFQGQFQKPSGIMVKLLIVWKILIAHRSSLIAHRYQNSTIRRSPTSQT